MIHSRRFTGKKEKVGERMEDVVICGPIVLGVALRIFGELGHMDGNSHKQSCL